MDGGLINSFDPSTNSASFRGTLGAYVTGVTLITTKSPEGPVGIIANSFASVSLDPPLVLWSPAKASKRFDLFSRSQHFAIHVLAANQREVCEAFVRSKAAFDICSWEPSQNGIPLVEGALAIFECDLHATHDGGDHDIVVGHVTRCHHRGAGAPLVFHSGKYGKVIET